MGAICRENSGRASLFTSWWAGKWKREEEDKVPQSLPGAPQRPKTSHQAPALNDLHRLWKVGAPAQHRPLGTLQTPGPLELHQVCTREC